VIACYKHSSLFASSSATKEKSFIRLTPELLLLLLDLRKLLDVQQGGRVQGEQGIVARLNLDSRITGIRERFGTSGLLIKVDIVDVIDGNQLYLVLFPFSKYSLGED
jgi:hypothetical protein